MPTHAVAWEVDRLLPFRDPSLAQLDLQTILLPRASSTLFWLVSGQQQELASCHCDVYGPTHSLVAVLHQHTCGSRAVRRRHRMTPYGVLELPFCFAPRL